MEYIRFYSMKILSLLHTITNLNASTCVFFELVINFLFGINTKKLLSKEIDQHVHDDVCLI